MVTYPEPQQREQEDGTLLTLKDTQNSHQHLQQRGFFISPKKETENYHYQNKKHKTVIIYQYYH